MIGLANPPKNQTILVRLAENATTEALATAGWVPVWGVTTALGSIAGTAFHHWDANARPIVLLVAVIPLSVSGIGVALHVLRMGIVGQQMLNLAKTGGDGGTRARAALAVSAPTRWIVVLQILLGVAVAIALRPQ